MSANEPENLTAEQRNAREALRRLGAPRATPEFRARLRENFVSGRLVARSTRAPRPAWARRPALIWGLAPLAAAAALVVAFGLNRGAPWRVTSSQGEGIAVVDGRPVPMGHMAEVGWVRPGSRVRVPDGSQLEILSPGSLMIQIAGGSDFIVPPAPPRWFGRAIRGELRSGELRITTGAAFHGARLALITPETRVEVTGTTLAVIREPAGTCVCVLEGRVRVAMPAGGMADVLAGRRLYVFADGRPSEEAEMRRAEHEVLPAFRDERRPLLEGNAER